MSTVTFIGDVHGQFEIYNRIRLQHDNPTIQVGDFGFGFEPIPNDLRETDRIVRGNHDNLTIAKTCPNWIPDGTVESNMMFVGGAFSVDRWRRIEGVDWWADEELSIHELGQMINIYEVAKPEIMVTHDCPGNMCHIMNCYENESRTNQAFDAMLDIHRPTLWIFGHYHDSRRFTVAGTEFICLNIYETLTIDV